MRSAVVGGAKNRKPLVDRVPLSRYRALVLALRAPVLGFWFVNGRLRIIINKI